MTPTQIEPLYKIEITCLNCNETFTTMRVRSKFKRTIKKDTDFCGYYQGVNPDHYIVRVCPNCGFAGTEHFSEKFTPEEKEDFKRKVTDRWQPKDFGRKRTGEDALECLKLALLCAQIKQESDKVISGILHHLAWEYRRQGKEEEERRFLRFALESYKRLYEIEPFDPHNVKLMYMIGELNRRLGEYNEAIRWFSLVVQDKKIMDSAMIRASREQWDLVCEEWKEQLGEELPQT
ncbi:DUF2225 domain-containing protein [Paenibacillus larvae]|uniref:DUF2225 domain-containing protein n=1 Tax=Paenibacillus larvae TaxID=1464 RepID=A0AAP5JPX9_9BACL|nr:DUF2225 domain-containing protein [Paenibacillus larvae]AVF22845.1 hypothetical protein ERICI_03035 [Paenibacillus larvae subsp. larvae]ETK26498.1 hypothetical protein ERIC1_2c07200 [Paenibacillus larvae subsp. larvae DSM 25719]MCY9561676.1 DUF2225 domain-containing protein [Paenibacillus larvae]MCY9566109.1 DUF2225 domain-containing protein [Paenibacillus larvae]MCY9571165.1 DUF2225 domain-containing protein [Paenibacillus larvae]